MLKPWSRSAIRFSSANAAATVACVETTGHFEAVGSVCVRLDEREAVRGNLLTAVWSAPIP
jgi:hypothetical protein